MLCEAAVFLWRHAITQREKRCPIGYIRKPDVEGIRLNWINFNVNLWNQINLAGFLDRDPAVQKRYRTSFDGSGSLKFIEIHKVVEVFHPSRIVIHLERTKRNLRFIPTSLGLVREDFLGTHEYPRKNYHSYMGDVEQTELILINTRKCFICVEAMR